MAKRTSKPQPKKKAATPGPAKIFSTRLQPDLRDALEREAKRKGHTLSQEVHTRLKHSFSEERQVADQFGGARTANVLRVIAHVVQTVRNPDNPNAEWLDDIQLYQEALAKIVWTLQVVQPKRPFDDDRLELIRKYDGSSNRLHVEAVLAAQDIWREIADANPPPLGARMTSQQMLANIVKTKIPDLVARTKTNSYGLPRGVGVPFGPTPDAFDEDKLLQMGEEFWQENYLCIYCREPYPKQSGHCPKCKGLDLSGQKHGGDRRTVKPNPEAGMEKQK